MVQRSRVHLADTVEHGVKPEEVRNPAFQVGEPVGVAVEQVEHVRAVPIGPLIPRSG